MRSASLGRSAGHAFAAATTILIGACAQDTPPPVGPDVIGDARAARAAAVGPNYVVNTTADFVDPDIDGPNDDGVCDDVANGTGDSCSLRAAMQNHNEHSPAGSVISFDLGSGTPTITLTLGGLSFVGTVTVDGNTGGATRVRIDGNAPTAGGTAVTLTGTGSRLSSLVVTGFSNGVTLGGSGGHELANSFIGTPGGVTVPQRMSGTGVRIQGAGDNEIRFNVVGGFDNGGIAIFGSSRNLVRGNSVGIGASGLSAIPNRRFGILVQGGAGAPANDNRIGGPDAPDGNVVGGSDLGAVGPGVIAPGVQLLLVSGAATNLSGNRIEGNFIGVNRARSVTLPNSGGGILAGGQSTDVVGNVVEGNWRVGISLSTFGTEGVITGNTVIRTVDVGAEAGVGIDARGGGVRVTGNTIESNAGPGLHIGGFLDPSVSDPTAAATGNTIRFNGREGVVAAVLDGTIANNVVADNGDYGILVQSDGQQITANTIRRNVGAGVSVALGLRRNRIRMNAIADNSAVADDPRRAGLGIDLESDAFADDGVTPNDPLDADGGSNDAQNFPELAAATLSGSTLSVTGTLHSTPGTTFTIDVYANTACDPSGHGEGETHLGSTSVTTDASGNATIAAALPAGGGEQITATATDPAGNTSEFSACVRRSAGTVSRRADIRPNVISLGGTFVVTGILLSEPGFDASQVQPASLRLAIVTPGQPVRWVPVVQRGGTFNTFVRDVDGDGDADLGASFAMTALRAGGLRTTSQLFLDVVVLPASDPPVVTVRGTDPQPPSIRP